jgi:hypothetical protein
LVAIEPLAYRTIIGNALQALRPRVEVVVVESEAFLVEVACLKPGLVDKRIFQTLWKQRDRLD